jgi:hypothetical protein
VCVAFNSQQLTTGRVAARRAARKWGASRREILTLLSAGLVESNLSQDYGPGEGDRDSVGFLQQRPSMGWGGYVPGRKGIRVDTDDFMRALRKTNTRGLSVGEAAQAVQRSAFPGRYQERLPDARALLGQLGGAGGAPGGGGGGSAGYAVPGVGGAQNQPMGSEGALALIEALAAQKPRQAPSSALTPPAHTAQAAMPEGVQLPAGGGGAAPAPEVDALLEQIRTVGGDVQLAPGNAGGQVPGVPGPGGLPVSGVGGRNGRVVVDPNADRAGARTRGYVVDAARRVSAIAGKPVRIGTGTNHSRLTVNGNVSDHWDGNAADIPASGRRLVRLGQAALIDAGMDPKEARKQNGGLFNVNGAQIIFATDEGGNHHDHLHYRPRAPRRR